MPTTTLETANIQDVLDELRCIREVQEHILERLDMEEELNWLIKDEHT